MSTIVMWFKKTLLAASIAGLGLAALPLADAFALGHADPPTPPAPGQTSNDKLEKIWAKEQSAYQKAGMFLDRSDRLTSKVQELIDKAKQNGKDVSALQAALDAFVEALKQAHPVYESGKGILASHPGFDEAGKVTDQTKAVQTVKDMGDKLREIRQILSGPSKALREAIQAFREANKPTPTPASPSGT